MPACCCSAGSTERYARSGAGPNRLGPGVPRRPNIRTISHSGQAEADQAQDRGPAAPASPASREAGYSAIHSASLRTIHQPVGRGRAAGGSSGSWPGSAAGASAPRWRRPPDAIRGARTPRRGRPDRSPRRRSRGTSAELPPRHAAVRAEQNPPQGFGSRLPVAQNSCLLHPVAPDPRTMSDGIVRGPDEEFVTRGGTAAGSGGWASGAPTPPAPPRAPRPARRRRTSWRARAGRRGAPARASPRRRCGRPTCRADGRARSRRHAG